MNWQKLSKQAEPPQLSLTGHGDERLKVIQAERGALAPFSRLILNGRGKVVAKNHPFSLVFSQIVALIFIHRSWFAGFLLFVAISLPPWLEMKLALAQAEESQGTFRGRNTRQRPWPASRRGPSSGSDSLTGAIDAPRR